MNENDRPTPALRDFDIGETVLAFHGTLLYEARVLQVMREPGCPAYSYTVHFQGWKKSWDETVSRDFVFEHTDENLLLAHRLLDGARKRQQALRPVSNGDENVQAQAQQVEKTMPQSSPPNAMFVILPALQRQLVDDYEFVTKEQRLVPLPRNTTVQSCLTKWISSRRPASDKATKEVAEALQTYFDAALSKILLYRFERQQYIDTFKNTSTESPMAPSAVYGAEHLLRLLIKLPYLLESTAVSKEKMQAIAEKVNELAKYIQKNGRLLLLTEYEPASAEYISRTQNI